jgi:hypothetical protein
MRLVTTWSTDKGALVIEGGSGLGSTAAPLSLARAESRVKARIEIETKKMLIVALTELCIEIMRMTSFVKSLDYHPFSVISGARFDGPSANSQVFGIGFSAANANLSGVWRFHSL